MATSIRFFTLIILILFSELTTSYAQLPQKNLVYINLGTEAGRTCDSLYNYDPRLPVSATNPWINTIALPTENAGLAISPVLGSGDTTLTYYTCVGGNYWYYDPHTLVWVNTGQFYGSIESLNIAAGGGYLYSLDGFLGYVCRYDGTNVVDVGEYPGDLPFDLLADCEGNFYIFRPEGPYFSMVEFAFDGTFVQGWTVINPVGITPSGGIANIGGDIYTDMEFVPRLAHARVDSGSITYDTATTAIVPILEAGFWVGDMASYGGAPLTDRFPTISIFAPDTTVCHGDSVAFTTIVTNSGSSPTYQWLINEVPISGATGNVFNYQPQDNDVVSVQLITNGGCSDITSTSPCITLHTINSTAMLSYGADSFCTNSGNPEPTLTVPAGGSYAATGALSIDPLSGAINTTAAITGSYVVSYSTMANGCATLAYDTISIVTASSLKITASGANICAGDTIQLAIQNNINPDSLLWSQGYYSIISTNVNEATVAVAQSGFIKVKTKNTFCASQDSVYLNVRPCCQLILPDGFTPNNDGRNDLFCPLGASHYTIQLFLIKNRWGQTVFQSTNNNICWDGTFNGIPAEMGSYYYLIEYTCNGSTKQLQSEGDITLIR